MTTDKMSDEQLLSKTISFLRFPLIVGVVLIHSEFHDVVIQGIKQVKITDYHIFSSVVYLVSETFARVAVPLFFFFSGFLFFYAIKDKGFTGSVYLSKLKKRAKTLLVPYVFWNLFMIIFLLLSQTLVPDLASGRGKIVIDYNVSDWLWGFWNASMINNIGNAYPINFPFWFIRNLMIVMLFSPLVYCVVRWLKHYAIILLGIAWILRFKLGVTGFSIDAFFFFTLGAYFSINGKNFVTIFRPYMIPITIIYLACCVIDLCFRNEMWVKNMHLHAINILLGMIVAITVSSYFIERGTLKVIPFLAEGSFFVYACHAMPLTCIIKLAFKLVHPHSNVSLLILYVVCPTLTILFGLVMYWWLKRLLPHFTAVIMGGR